MLVRSEIDGPLTPCYLVANVRSRGADSDSDEIYVTFVHTDGDVHRNWLGGDARRSKVNPPWEVRWYVLCEPM